MREDRIYTLHQAARRLALPAKALRVLVDDGTIPHVKAGGHVLIELTAAEEAIARRARELPAGEVQERVALQDQVAQLSATLAAERKAHADTRALLEAAQQIIESQSLRANLEQKYGLLETVDTQHVTIEALRGELEDTVANRDAIALVRDALRGRVERAHKALRKVIEFTNTEVPHVCEIAERGLGETDPPPE